MSLLFRHHFTRDEARSLLPEVNAWLDQLAILQEQFDAADRRLVSLLAGGCDVGGDTANRWVTTLARMQSILGEFHRREIQIKDPARGLVDFPALINGREVFLCWEKGEDDIEFWHDLESGYAGRERL